MKLEEVLPRLREGKNIRHKSMADGDFYTLSLFDIKLGHSFCDRVEVYSFDVILRSEDILSEDWEVCE